MSKRHPCEVCDSERHDYFNNANKSCPVCGTENVLTEWQLYVNIICEHCDPRIHSCPNCGTDNKLTKKDIEGKKICCDEESCFKNALKKLLFNSYQK
jgi:RNA polymerase subunit RPABC4/transcription elongation factor Spt4